MAEDAKLTLYQCPMESTAKTCDPFDDPRSHDFSGWEEFDDGRGGTAVCSKCGITAFSHSMRYGP
jgi:hypothetical protein